MSYLPVDRRMFLKGCAAGAATLATQSATIAMAKTVGWRKSATAQAAGSQSTTPFPWCGLFNPVDGPTVTESGAQAVRIIVDPRAYNKNGNALPADTMTLLNNYPPGIPLILTLFWFNNKNSGTCDSGNGPTYLEDQNQNQWAQYAIDLIQGVNAALPQGTVVGFVTLENEPFDQYAAKDLVENPQNPGMLSNAGVWFNLLAETIGEWASTASPNLKISSPAWTNTSEAGYKTAFYKWFEGAVAQVPQYITYFDFHAHVGGKTNQDCLNGLQGVIDQVSKYFQVMNSSGVTPTVMCTEWSQAFFFTEWLKAKVSPCYSSKYKVPDGVSTNHDYIASFQGEKTGCSMGTKAPTTADKWNDLIASSGVNGGFICKANTMLVNAGVSIPCYGGAKQYGNPMFDVDALYANITVSTEGPPVANYGFLQWYQQLTFTPASQPIPTDLTCPGSGD